MTLKESLTQVADRLTEDRLAQLLEFAQFLESRSEQQDWHSATRARFAQAYGADEPEYTPADIKESA